MPFTWTGRQFVGGNVALDLANTLCYRSDPVRSFDKLATVSDLQDFGEAAARYVGPNAGLPAGEPALVLGYFRELRDSIDAVFRPATASAPLDAQAVRKLLRFCENTLASAAFTCGAEGLALADPDGAPLSAQVAHGAIQLAFSSEINRVKSCPNCHWLFIDRSRNGSRVWCDMLTCGNRAKAERHQVRRRRVKPANAVTEV